MWLIHEYYCAAMTRNNSRLTTNDPSYIVAVNQIALTTYISRDLRIAF